LHYHLLLYNEGEYEGEGMTDWTAGYVTDIDYTFGYYSELNPLRSKLALLNRRLHCPDFQTGCELGFGQGISVNIHAAAGPAAWVGTDFNPAHAAFAQELSVAAKLGARLFDDSFEQFAARDDLPDFDYIGLHGVWSWISDENRAALVDFFRRKLKVGGVLYISYNTLPGWSGFMPMRNLLTEHAQTLGATGQGIVANIDQSLDFAEKLLAVKPKFVASNPQITEQMTRLKGMSRNYLAHEYFNRDWHPMHFATIANWLGGAKLSFACSAHLADHTDGINLTAEQSTFLRTIQDPDFRESVRDYIVNQQFRRDYWVKGPRILSGIEQAEMLRKQRLIMTRHRSEASSKVTGAVGEASLREDIYKPILDLMADNKPRTIGEIERALPSGLITFPILQEAVMLLTGSGDFSPVQDDGAIKDARIKTRSLNANILERAPASAAHTEYLASPVTGGGISVNRIVQLFLLARMQGKKTAKEWAQFTWQILQAQGQRLLKDGAPLQSPEENIAEIERQASEFERLRLPVLVALQIA
jgi:SAM-dependent methyltransferase